MRTTRIFLAAMVAAVLSFGLLAGPAAAGEVDSGQYPAKPQSEVLDNSVSRPVTQSATQVLDSSASLPVTGGDVVGLTAIGVLFVAVGVGFTAYRRHASA